MRNRFIFTADWHIGPHNYGKIDRQTGICSAANKIIENAYHITTYAVTHEVDIIFVLGDIFDKPGLSTNYRKLFAKWVHETHMKGIDVKVLVGNHDWGNHSYIFEDWLHVVDETVISILDTPINFICGQCEFFVIPHLQSIDKKQETWFQAFDRIIKEKFEDRLINSESNTYKILLGHFPIRGSQLEASSYKLDDANLITVGQIREYFDYAFLGDIHKPQEKDSVYYTGSIEKLNFGAREDEKSFLYADFSKKFPEIRRIPIKTNKLRQIELRFGEYTSSYVGLEDSIVKVVVSCSLEQIKNQEYFDRLKKELIEHRKVKQIHTIFKNVSFGYKTPTKKCLDKDVSLEQVSENYIKSSYNEHESLNTILEENKSYLKQ